MVLLPGCACCTGTGVTCQAGDWCNYSATVNGQNFPATCSSLQNPAVIQQNICTGSYIDTVDGLTNLWQAASRTYTSWSYGAGGSKLEMYITNPVYSRFSPVSFADISCQISLSQKLIFITSVLRWEYVRDIAHFRQTKTRRWQGQFNMDPCVFRENAFCDGVARLSSLLPGSFSVYVQDENATASVGGTSLSLTLLENTNTVFDNSGSGFGYWGSRFPVLACHKQAAESFSLNIAVSYDSKCPGPAAP